MNSFVRDRVIQPTRAARTSEQNRVRRTTHRFYEIALRWLNYFQKQLSTADESTQEQEAYEIESRE